MKICWDNLEKIRYVRQTGNFRLNRTVYYEYDTCLVCREPYLGNKENRYCSIECAYQSEDRKKNISINQPDISGKNNPMYGKKHSDKTRKKISINHANVKGENNPLCLHHINYIKKECQPNNLITLCISCNSIANYNREWHKTYYNEIMKRKSL